MENNIENNTPLPKRKPPEVSTKVARKKKKKKIIIIIGVIILFLIIISFAFGGKNKTEYTFAQAEKKSLIQTVSETGTIKSVNEVELSFSNSGKISEIPIKIGQQVSSTDILAKLDYEDLSIKQREYQANLEIAQAKLDKLVAGATSYELAVSEANVNKARTAYLTSIQELESIRNTVQENISQAENNKISEINNKKTDALLSIETNASKGETAIDNINTILDDQDTQNLLGARDTSTLSNTKTYLALAIDLENNVDSSLNTAKLTNDENNINTALDICLNFLNKVFATLNYSYDMLENTITSSSFTQTELDTYKSTISTQITTISTAISYVQVDKQDLNNTILSTNNALNSAIISGEQQIVTYEAKVDTNLELLKLTEAESAKLNAPAAYQDIVLYQAQVKQAQASLASVTNQIQNSIIKAPINGVITKIKFDVGEQVNTNSPVIYLLTNNELELEIDISETDINKISKSDRVEITLDAFGDDLKFYGQVYDIEPAETIIQDVTYYKIKIQFDPPEDLNQEIKPGMTANATIITAEKENILVVPARAIVEKNGQGKVVRILENEKIKEINVKTGIYGDEGLVEIISGLEEGQEIIAYIKE